MKLADSLKKELILPDLEAKDKVDCIMEFSQAIAQTFPFLKKDDTAHLLLEREKLGSTGIQEGIAIPHGKFKGMEHMVLLFGRSLNGIDFQSFDNKPTHLFFVLLAPENASTEHLKLLARLSRLLKKRSLREDLLKAKDAEEIYQILCEEDERLL